MARGKDGKYIWRQETPAMQLVILQQHMEGNFENWAHGSIHNITFTFRLREAFDELRELLKYAAMTSWPVGSRSSESE
jgi:hypothetical protein